LREEKKKRQGEKGKEKMNDGIEGRWEKRE